jgi:hypothetical protein
MSVILTLICADLTLGQIWEPTLAGLLDSPSGKLIDEVWVWESVQHGDAALINRESLSRWCEFT